MFLLSRFLRGFVRKGRLQLYDATGKLHVFGGVEEGPDITLRLHDPSLHWKFAINPELHAPVAYMDGTMTLENCDLREFLMLFSVNRIGLAKDPIQKIIRKVWMKLRRFQHNNSLSRAPEHVAHHYDLSNKLYQLFLDDDMQYSMAYYKEGNETFEQAQRNAVRAIAAKLKLEDGMKIVEIGCGWGGLSLYLSQVANVEITGLTLSKEQQKLAQARADVLGVGDRVKFELMDYRKMGGKFDRVVSIEMLEHVGAYRYDEYFGAIFRLLKPEGFGIVHCGARMIPPGTTGPFLRKYIAPGLYYPAMSEILSATERQHLWVADIEFLRQHYVPTMLAWQERFENNRAEIAEILDERFCRMWELWLIMGEFAMRHGSHMVFSTLVSPTRDAVPISRDYMLDAERDLMKREKSWNKKLARSLPKNLPKEIAEKVL